MNIDNNKRYENLKLKILAKNCINNSRDFVNIKQ